jgi:hypothetical protein
MTESKYIEMFETPKKEFKSLHLKRGFKNRLMKSKSQFMTNKFNNLNEKFSK